MHGVNVKTSDKINYEDDVHYKLMNKVHYLYFQIHS